MDSDISVPLLFDGFMLVAVNPSLLRWYLMIIGLHLIQYGDLIVDACEPFIYFQMEGQDALDGTHVHKQQEKL